MLVIGLPQKIWQKKVDCALKMPVYDDIDDGVFEFQSYGKCVFRPHNTWKQGSRSDIIEFHLLPFFTDECYYCQITVNIFLGYCHIIIPQILVAKLSFDPCEHGLI